MIEEIGLYFLGVGALFSIICFKGEVLLFPMGKLLSYFGRLKCWFGDSFGLISGEALLFELGELLYQQGGLSKGSEIALPQYKFYTTLIKTILRGMREFGGDGREVLSSLKEAVAADLRFDRVLSELFNSALIQFLSIAFVTWAFALLAGHLTNFQATSLTLITVALLQVGGLFLFGFLFFRLRTKHFAPYTQCASILCNLRSMAKAGLSVQRTLEGLTLSELSSERELGSIKKRLERLIYSYSVLGAPISKELDYLISDLW
ncbi:MAG: hypothetical protein KAG61_02385, partial [Bacteriovoracaceae bacterium]|nr:hypothetical protein [Bacteriovoracaceae bacterium]